MPARFLNLDPIAFRVGTVILGVALVTFLLFGATSFFGDAVATTANTVEIAEFSKSMASTNPKSYRAASILKEQSFREEDLRDSLKDAETAVALSPNDYFLWQALARLKERSGDVLGAEKALRKALELAPNYASVQWALGNVLLRQEKYDEGFRLIRKAVDGNPRFGGPAASIAWDIFEGDREKIQNAVGDSVQVKAALVVYLGRLKRLEEAFDLWRTIPKADRAGTYAKDGQKLLRHLVASKRFFDALAVERDILGNSMSLPKAEGITNGGFEFDIARNVKNVFNWSIAKGESPSIGVSIKERKSGAKSLALVYSGGAKKEFRDVSQTVAVKGGSSYKLSLNYKANLSGKQTLVWIVSDGVTGKTIAATEPIDLISDWKTIETPFTVPEGTEAVRIKLQNEPCPNVRCPIRGSVWFDDFKIEK